MKKCIIITTINKPTETIFRHINNNKYYDLIIVGDKKTPDDYYSLDCTYLDIKKQHELFPELSNLIPYNHYCRKNIGYLYAIKNNYDIIYETDDDNIPFDNFDHILKNEKTLLIKEKNSIWMNIFKFFTNNSHIWPRGYPLSLVKSKNNFEFEESDIKPAIINGLVENDPDVDALYRLLMINNVSWEANKKVIISNDNMCVFNSQNTFWLNKDLFITLLIPCSVSFRYCDILRGIISNIILKKTNNYMMYTSPTVTQLRNEHDLMCDFKSEIEMYVHNENIIEILKDIKGNNTKELLLDIYNTLKDNNIITQLDLDIQNKWITYFHI